MVAHHFKAGNKLSQRDSMLANERVGSHMPFYFLPVSFIAPHGTGIVLSFVAFYLKSFVANRPRRTNLLAGL